MIIVSQDRLSVVDADNIVSFDGNVDEYPQQVIAVFSNGKGMQLGKFNDDARVKEVISEFVTAYAKRDDVFYVPKE